MIIRVDFDFSYATKPFTFKSFCFLLERLYHKGFRVNNSFYHVYRRRNTATTLDGGQIGSFSSLGDKRNIARAVAHRRKLSVNCIMDVFSINSVLCGSVSDNAKDRIAAIVGKHFVKTVADYFVFALPYQEAIDSIYYIQRYCKVNRLREIIKAEGLLS